MERAEIGGAASWKFQGEGAVTSQQDLEGRHGGGMEEGGCRKLAGWRRLVLGKDPPNFGTRGISAITRVAPTLGAYRPDGGANRCESWDDEEV